MENFIKYHDTSKQVSLTGARALILLVALAEGPKKFEDIRQFVIDCGVADRAYSIDTIRIDINTLKKIGCEITKATKRNNHQYALISHPYKINISNEEIKALKVIYEKISKTASPKKLLDYHYLFEHIANITSLDEIKEQLLGISLLKSENLKLIKSLVADEKCHNRVKILYSLPHQEDIEYDITIEKLGLRNGKLYVYCFNNSNQKRSFLNVSRIKEILCTLFDKNTPVGLDTCVKFKLYSHQDYRLEENETIIEELENHVIIQGRYFNEFIAVQRMLSFGPDCIIEEPSKIKNTVISKLKEMRSVYGK